MRVITLSHGITLQSLHCFTLPLLSSHHKIIYLRLIPSIFIGNIMFFFLSKICIHNGQIIRCSEIKYFFSCIISETKSIPSMYSYKYYLFYSYHHQSQSPLLLVFSVLLHLPPNLFFLTFLRPYLCSI